MQYVHVCGIARTSLCVRPARSVHDAFSGRLIQPQADLLAVSAVANNHGTCHVALACSVCSRQRRCGWLLQLVTTPGTRCCCSAATGAVYSHSIAWGHTLAGLCGGVYNLRCLACSFHAAVCRRHLDCFRGGMSHYRNTIRFLHASLCRCFVSFYNAITSEAR